MARVFNNFREAFDEVGRELYEMGISVPSHSYQDKVTEGNDDFVTKELQGYQFVLCNANLNDALSLINEKHRASGVKWTEQELRDRFDTLDLNPGRSWNYRSDTWKQFLEADGRFSYTYNERFRPQIDRVIGELAIRPYTRQAIVEVYAFLIDQKNMGGNRRIPCSMHYQFMIREGRLDIFYVMRSNDYLTHFIYDIALAIGIQHKVCEQIKARPNKTPDLIPGNLHYYSVSLHAFNKDLKALGIF